MDILDALNIIQQKINHYKEEMNKNIDNKLIYDLFLTKFNTAYSLFDEIDTQYRAQKGKINVS